MPTHSLSPLQLWSLAVAVSLPRVNGSAAGRFSFFSSALALNIHFIGGPIFGCFAIVVPSSLSGIHYDIAITHYTKMTSMLEDYAPRFANMTTSDSALALSKLEVVIQPMLDELDFFSMSYKVSWIIWTSIILYTYSVSRPLLNFPHRRAHLPPCADLHLRRDPLLSLHQNGHESSRGWGRPILGEAVAEAVMVVLDLHQPALDRHGW